MDDDWINLYYIQVEVLNGIVATLFGQYISMSAVNQVH